MAEFRGDDPFAALVLRRAADQPLGGVIAIAFGGVDEIDAEVAGAREDLIRLVLRELFPPLAAELPRADADDRHIQICVPKPAILHDQNSALGDAGPSTL